VRDAGSSEPPVCGMIEPLRVLHLLGSAGFAGTERHVLRLAGELSRLECAVWVAGPPGAAELRAEARKRGIPVLGLVGMSHIARPDVVHVHDGRSALAGVLAVSATKAALVRSQHFVRPASVERRGVMRALSVSSHRLLNRRLDGYIAVSDAAAAAAVARRDAPGARTATIGPGVDIAKPEQVAAARAARARSPAPCVASAGRFEPERRFDILLDAVPAVLDALPACRFVIAGSGSAEIALRQQAVQLGIADAITWSGWLEDITSVLAAAHVYVNTWPWEGFGMATAEAMGYALPVIGVNSGATPELVDDGVTGRLVPPVNPAALATALIDLLSDRRTADALGMAGRDRAVRQYSAQATGEAMLAYYRELVSLRAGR
jgi:glycosyltransferase involved in cell wall biosynthesis